MSISEDLLNIAKKNLVRDGFLQPVFFLLQGEELVMPPSSMAMLDRIYARMGGEPLNMEDTKSQQVYMIGILAKAVEANRVIMIWDAAFKTVDVANAQQAYNDPTERPLLYPKAMRTECIILNEVLLPEGKDTTLIVPYKGGGEEPVTFIENEDINKAMKEGGRYESRFTEIILDGYKTAEGKLR